MRICWASHLDAFHYPGGGELTHRALIVEGRRRGHRISVAALLRSRSQRGLRRRGVLRGPPRIDWDADAFVVANIRNVPTFPRRFPEPLVQRMLDTGRAAVYEDAYVDVCPHDLAPCGGDRTLCPATCDKQFARALYAKARLGIFVSPLHRDVIGGVLDMPMPPSMLVKPQVDVRLFRPLGLERDIDVLYVGTISRAKGYANLLERFGPERMTFVGPNELGAPVQGRWLGRVPHERLPAIYNRAATFAHLPEWIEPMGRTPVEAALCGCDVVMNDRVGVATHARTDWTDPEVVARNPARFWEEFEAAFA